MGDVAPPSRMGEADRFRDASWLERTVAQWRARGGASAPRILKRGYEYVLDRLPGDHLLATLPGGERVQLAARYRHLNWNPHEYAAFRAAVKPGATVFDIGANVGAYTLVFAARVGPSGRVIAFEPAPDASQGLRTHLALNGIAGRVEVIEAAMSSAVGRTSFAVHPSGGASSLVLESVDRGRVIDVATDTLDRFCAAHAVSPDVLKIDVEGSELDVLRGGRATLARADIQVFVEFHPAVWRSLGVSRADVEAELSQQGFVAEPIGPSFDVWNTEGVAVRLRRR